MKRVLSQIVLISICVFAGYAQNNNDWANLARYQDANKQLTTAPDVVFMGNSITEGWYREDPDFFKNNNFVGRGIGGQVTSQMLCRFPQDVIALKPKAVVILAGINDIAHNTYYAPNVDSIASNIKSMAELAMANNITVVLCTLVAADTIGWRPEIDPKVPVSELNEKIDAYADEKGLQVADMFSITSNSNGGLKTEYRFPSGDPIHPALAGYKAMEDEVLDALKLSNVLQ